MFRVPFLVAALGAAVLVPITAFRHGSPMRCPYARLATDEADEPQYHAATDAQRKAAMTSIKDQLEAFKKGDYKKAETYQSAGLRKNFATPAEFQRMMESAYPEFANYRSVTFGQAEADPHGQHVRIRVTLTGEDGVVVRATYVLVMEDKLYRVESVFGGARPVPAPPDMITA